VEVGDRYVSRCGWRDAATCASDRSGSVGGSVAREEPRGRFLLLEGGVRPDVDANKGEPGSSMGSERQTGRGV
jgi:hypothetical protein